MSLIAGKYEILQSLGSGTYGTVYKVESTDKSKRNKTFACKEIDYGKMNDKEKELLVSEVNILRELDHLHIVHYVDRYIEKEKTKLYIIMEFCGGGDLAQYIKNHRAKRQYVKEDRIWNIFVQILMALYECHHHKPKKVLHRDLKPGNIMLDEDGKIKIADFGLARTLGQESLAKTTVGTPLYMAPEQIGKAAYDEKCDVWALGCVLYELAALSPPFTAKTTDSLHAKIRLGKYPPLSDKVYSRSLMAIIDKMLCKSPQRRPTIGDLLRDAAVQPYYREYKEAERDTGLKSREDLLKQQELALKKERELIESEKRELARKREELKRLSEQLDRREAILRRRGF
ncbi:Kinase, NEK [Aduncisulcus paluster]|uniref:non-specific serine/threonine protein kinase n=1 Tax=Aduncisulcus paluster TaxID=2918883 RepID=A0ABQ5KMF0_9EUKA|nr:Kinase, NEK [Aduncisulcus paluster]